MRIDLCRSCNAAVQWTRTSKGKPMPLDADPHPDGTFLALPDPHAAGPTIAEFIPAALRGQYPGKLHRSHFATCPNAAAHRKAGQR